MSNRDFTNIQQSAPIKTVKILKTGFYNSSTSNHAILLKEGMVLTVVDSNCANNLEDSWECEMLDGTSVQVEFENGELQ